MTGTDATIRQNALSSTAHLRNCQEAAGMLYGARESVLSRSEQLSPGRHGNCPRWPVSSIAAPAMLLNEGLQVQHA